MQADIGYGSKFQRGTGSGPVTYANVGEITAFSPPSFSREVVDATHFESPGGFREFIGALRDAGEASYTIQFDSPADLAAIVTDYKSDAAVPYRIVWPDGTNWDFDGLVTSFEPETPLDDKMTATVTIKLTGRPTFMAA